MADEEVAASQAPLDSGLSAFVALARFLGKSADAAQLRHEFSTDGRSFTSKHGLIYPVRVRLDTSTIGVDGKPVVIAPGIAVSAEIITGERRVIEYVLSPIQRYRHESARER